ncbi:hypothetical protein [Xanthomarina sp. F2636L]|uniref:hypothetical protein n=1 Tax=Xanthomarina sp. F2636L TaxID=2996018 RepID=UPI00225E1BC8|nr:hypothetical protein [Xanthomarina sp. F2636L]MCX7552045.1 hypothetical protein [Xanthomarina sp. F2636L]
MKNLYLFLLSISCFLGYSQDYILNENFKEARDIKFRLAFEPDWNRDFFIETNVRPTITKTPNKELAQLLFGFDEDSDSYYGLAIQYSSNLNIYADYYAVSSINNSTFIENNNEWQPTSIVNHSAYNRLQIYKIDDELYFSINDQVVAHISEIKAKGKELRLRTGESGISCEYIHAYYLNDINKQDFKSKLTTQLAQYKTSKIHHKIANDYPKVEALKPPAKLPKSSDEISTYLPEYDAIVVSNLNYYDLKTFNLLSNEDLQLRLKKTVIRNNLSRNAEILMPNKPMQILEGYKYIDWLNDKEILVCNNKNYRVYTYNLDTKTYKKLFKGTYGQKNFLSNNKRYLSMGWHVYDMLTGKEIKFPNNFNRRGKILSCFDEYIILQEDLFATYKINIKTGKKEFLREEGTYQGQYFIETNGRELNITDLITGKKVVSNLQLLTGTGKRYTFTYFPERNEVFVSGYVDISPQFYFSYNDAVKNTSAYIVNTKTNEITPFLLYKTSTEMKKNEEALQATRAKGKQEVKQFLSQFKTFGNSYTLNYNNYDYVNISSDPLMNKNGIGGITHAIGKFCTYDGGAVLALGISNNQYTVELITVTYSVRGVHVRRKILGTTQVVNGNTTQIAHVYINRDSMDDTKYTLVVDDGRRSETKLISNCNLY